MWHCHITAQAGISSSRFIRSRNIDQGAKQGRKRQRKTERREGKKAKKTDRRSPKWNTYIQHVYTHALTIVKRHFLSYTPVSTYNLPRYRSRVTRSTVTSPLVPCSTAFLSSSQLLVQLQNIIIQLEEIRFLSRERVLDELVLVRLPPDAVCHWGINACLLACLHRCRDFCGISHCSHGNLNSFRAIVVETTPFSVLRATFLA